MSSEAFIAKPGEDAYIGAGYCVMDRVLEIAARQPFETLLQSRLNESLGLKHTTYFPSNENGI